jgi:nicotinamide riboside kinase
VASDYHRIERYRHPLYCKSTTTHVCPLQETSDIREDHLERHMVLNTLRRLWVADNVRHLYTIWFQRYGLVAL